MANASAALYSDMSMFHNIAALGNPENSFVTFGYDYLDFVSLNNIYLQYVHVFPTFNGGLSIFRTGDEYLNEFVASVGGAHKLGISSIGVKINYHQLYAETFGYSRSATLSAGVITRISEDLLIGAYLNNAAVITINSKLQDYYIPRVIHFGISYKVSDKLLLALTASKDLDYELILASGISYNILQQVVVRTGVNWLHKNFYYGFGWGIKKINLDYAFNPMTNIGRVHSLTISYKLAAPNEK